MQWNYQQHKLKPKIIFDRSFLSYSLLVQVGKFRSTNRTVFLTAIPLQSLNLGNKMGILLQFKRLFHGQSYLPVIVIHVQLYSFKFNVLGTRNSLKKKKRLVELI